MDDFDSALIIWGFVAMIVASIIVFAATHFSEKNREEEAKRKQEEELSAQIAAYRSRLDKFSNTITRIAKQLPGGASDSLFTNLQMVNRHAETKYRSIQPEEEILKEAYACSSIGLCGVSAGHFWYQLLHSNCAYTEKYNSVSSMFDAEKDVRCYDKIRDALNKKELLLVDSDLHMLEEKTEFLEALENGTFKPCWKSIPLKDIQFYRIEGNVHYASDTYGAGGAILGTGAMNIRTDIKSLDNRRAILFYLQDGKMNTLEANPGYAAFRSLIPEKEESIVQMQTRQANELKQPEEPPKLSAGDLSVPQQIKQYKELLDMGAITQEEFDAKKKQLLGL